MKILILGTAYPWRGGIAHYISLLARHLAERHQVDVVTFTRQYPSLFFPGTTQNETGDPGVILKTESMMDSVNPFNWIRTGLRLRKRNYDLVVFKYWLPFFGPCFGTICRLIKRRRKTKIIAICDNVLPHERRPGDKVFTRYAFGVVDGFIVQSEAVEKDLLRLFPAARYKKVPHPVYENFGAPLSVSEARKKLGLDEKEHVLLFFGYIRKYKGLDILLESMRTVRKSVKLTLLVAGECYDDEQLYRDIIERYQMNDCVRFMAEYISNDRVPEFFSAADCVVLPYRSATQSGIVQIAYNFNTPVIVTDVGGLAEIVIDGVSGFVVPPESPEKLAEAIIRFYRNDCGQSLREGVRKEKAKYSWNHITEAIETLSASPKV